MLTLLAGIFFGGFILGLDGSLTPSSDLVAAAGDVGIRAFQAVMLAASGPATEDILVLSALVVIYGSIAVFALRRSLRSK